MHKPYTLEIISAHPEFKNKPLRKYAIDGIETIGAWGDEPFEIKFHNHTSDKVQVKVSVDGTDVLSGDPASTKVTEQMWLVYGHGTLTLKAWPESNNGGAQFVFTHADKGVALNTHGDVSSKGIIAVAVFEEGDPEPVRIENHHHYHYSSYHYGNSSKLGGSQTWNSPKGISPRKRMMKCAANPDSITRGGSMPASLNNSVQPQSLDFNESFNSSAAVGAGSYVNQNITYAQGLRKPVLSETVKVRYMWWDDLKTSLVKYGYTSPQEPTGFPADEPEKRVNLAGVPRVNTKKGVFQRSPQEGLTRF